MLDFYTLFLLPLSSYDMANTKPQHIFYFPYRNLLNDRNTQLDSHNQDISKPSH